MTTSWDGDAAANRSAVSTETRESRAAEARGTETSGVERSEVGP